MSEDPALLMVEMAKGWNTLLCYSNIVNTISDFSWHKLIINPSVWAEGYTVWLCVCVCVYMHVC